MKIQIKINDSEIKTKLGEIKTKLGNMKPAMELIGSVVKNSVIKNFQVGGRPSWKPSLRARQQRGQTLRDRGRLMNSIKSQAFNNKVIIGTNVKYAAIHQFGFDGTISIHAHVRKIKSRTIRKKIITQYRLFRKAEFKTKIVARGIAFVSAYSKNMHMPKRPFLMVQNEDWNEINSILGKYIMNKGG